jgi:hypothetical protein
VLENLATKQWDHRATLKFLERAMNVIKIRKDRNAANGSILGLKIHTGRSRGGRHDVNIPGRKDLAAVWLNSSFDPQLFQSQIHLNRHKTFKDNSIAAFDK